MWTSDPGSNPLAGVVLGSILVNSRLVCLAPVGILIMLRLFELFVLCLGKLRATHRALWLRGSGHYLNTLICVVFLSLEATSHKLHILIACFIHVGSVAWVLAMSC